MPPLSLDPGLNEALGIDTDTIRKGRQLINEEHDLKIKIAALREKLSPTRELLLRAKYGYNSIDNDVEGSKRIRDTLQAKLQDTESSLRTCQDALAPIEERLKASIHEHAQREHQKLFADLHTSLPQELRDMIYAYLYNELTLDRIGTQIKRQISDICCETDGKCPRSFDVPLYLHRDYVPLQVRTEILREGARLLSDKSHIIRTSRQLEKFAKTRALHLDVPVSYFFKSVSIQIILPKILAEWQREAPSHSKESPMSEAAWAAFEADFRKPIMAVPQDEKQTLTFDILLWETMLPQNSGDRCRKMVETVIEDLQKCQTAKIVALWCDDRVNWPYTEDRMLLARWETLRKCGADPDLFFDSQGIM